MERTSLEKFFAGKLLRVPPYQRDYAWMPANVDDLWTDIKEALDLSTSHYLGTFILAKRAGDDSYDLVDGQQRLTTITMLMKALIERMPENDRKRIAAELSYLEDASGRPRLTLLGENQQYFESLLAGEMPEPRTGGQKRLANAFKRTRELVAQTAEDSPEAVSKWMEGVGKLNVLEFVEENQGNAIRIFETVNDRGRPLATIDKIKSFLIYVSNRYLHGALDDALQDRFGRIFRAFDTIKEVGGEAISVELIQRERFAEDTVLQYHFFAYPTEYHDFRFTPGDVLSLFLKIEVKQHIANHQIEELRAFVDDYSSDLAVFFEALAQLMRRAETEAAYYKLFTSLPLSARLYPLLIRLATRGMLDAACPGADGRTFRDVIEAADVRVYKTRGTDPVKDMARLAADARDLTSEEIALRMADFVRKFMDDFDFQHALTADAVYEMNEATRHILAEFDGAISVKQDGMPPEIATLKALRAKEPTIDHILAQSPSFAEDARGFQDAGDYYKQYHRLGNLTLVEKSINSAAQGKTPEQKARDDKLYKASGYAATRRLGAALTASAQEGRLFGVTHVTERTQELAAFACDHWKLWS